MSALRALQVDTEISPLVQRTFSLAALEELSGPNVESNGSAARSDIGDRDTVVLRTEYKATTNRMLRVAVNGYMESLIVVLGVMEELDFDVLDGPSAG